MTFGVFVPSFRPVFDPIGVVVTPPAADWWEAGSAPTPLAVYQPKGAASQAVSYINLVNPGTCDAAPGDAPSWSSAGWTMNGTSNYLTTGLIAAGDQSWSILVRYANATPNNGALIGNYRQGTNDASILLFLSSDTTMTAYNGSGYPNGYVIGAGIPTAGVLAVAGRQVYVDGVAEGGTIPAVPAAGAMRQIFVGAANYHIDSDSPGLYQAATIIAVAIWNTSTDHATWMPAVSAAVALI